MWRLEFERGAHEMVDQGGPEGRLGHSVADGNISTFDLK